MRQGRDGGWRDAGPVSGRRCHGALRDEPYPGSEPPCSRRARGVPGLFRGGFGGRRRGLEPRWEKPECVDVMGLSELEELPLPQSALFWLSVQGASVASDI